MSYHGEQGGSPHAGSYSAGQHPGGYAPHPSGGGYPSPGSSDPTAQGDYYDQGPGISPMSAGMPLLEPPSGAYSQAPVSPSHVTPHGHSHDGPGDVEMADFNGGGANATSFGAGAGLLPQSFAVSPSAPGDDGGYFASSPNGGGGGGGGDSDGEDDGSGDTHAIDWNSRDYEYYRVAENVSCPSSRHFALPLHVHAALQKCFKLEPFQLADPVTHALGLYHLKLYLLWAFQAPVAEAILATVAELPFRNDSVPFPDWLTLNDVYLIAGAIVRSDRIPTAGRDRDLRAGGPGGVGFAHGAAGGALSYVKAEGTMRPTDFDPALYFCLRTMYTDMEADPVFGCLAGDLEQPCFTDLLQAMRGDSFRDDVQLRLAEENSAYEAAQGKAMYVTLAALCEMITKVEATRHKANNMSSFEAAEAEMRKAAVDFDYQEAEERKRLNTMSTCGRCCYTFSKWWRHSVLDKRHIIPIWRKSFDEIEARFGPSVVAFFYFAQSMFWLNVILTCVLAVIFVPGMISFDWSAPAVEVTRMVNGVATTVRINQSLSGLVIGTGMEYSFMFYGDGYKRVYPETGFRMYLAWVFVCVAALIVSLIENLSRFHFISHDDEVSANNKFSRLAFAGYNFNMREASEHQIQSMSFMTRFYNLLTEVHDDQVSRGTDAAASQVGEGYYRLKLRRLLGAFMTLVFLAASAVLVAYLIINKQDVEDETESSLGWASDYLVPACITIIKLMVPQFVYRIVAFERYDRASDEFRHKFFRIFIMKMFFVLLILFQTQALKQSENVTCLQTLTGVIYYRMMFTDLVADIITSLIFPSLMHLAKLKILGPKKVVQPRQDDPQREHLRYEYEKMLLTYKPNDLRKNEFRLPENMIDIMYRQALVWSAMCYSPVISIIGALFMAAAITIKKIQVKYLTCLPFQPMGVQSQLNRFRSYMLATIGLVCIPISFFLRTRVNCGIYLDTVRSRSTPFDAILRWANSLPGALSVISNILMNAAFLWVALLLCVILAIYASKKFTGYNKEVSLLRSWLKLEKQQTAAFLREHRIKLSPDDVQRSRQFAAFTSALPPAMAMRFMTCASDNGINTEWQIFALPQAYLRAFLEKAFSQGASIDEYATEHSMNIINSMRPMSGETNHYG